MARKKKNTPMAIEDAKSHLATLVCNEWDLGQGNQTEMANDFEAIIDMLECLRTEKEYEWMSDIFIPEFPSIFNTEASLWANQMFGTRDFVEIYLEGDRPGDQEKCRAAKKLINKTLNRRELFHYQKYMRARSINSLSGHCYLVCGWEQDIKETEIGTKLVPVLQQNDEYGQPITDQNAPRAIMGTQEEPVLDKKILIDRFNYEVMDPRNVATDNSYVYSIQDKDWVVLRSARSLAWLKDHEEKSKYINLDELEKVKPQTETDTSRETYNKDQQEMRLSDPQVKYFDILDRYGKIWAIVEERDKQWGLPSKIKYGIDDDGNILKDAELVEALLTVAYSGSSKVLIRFIPARFITDKGVPYRPICRGLCYIHPTKDIGMSDGKYSRELQVGLNDTINMGNDRTRLATLPVLKARKYSTDDNDQIYIEPEHVIPLENIDDLQELVIRDDPRGALNMAALFTAKMQQVNSIYPTTMGDLPGKASTTATAVAGAQSNTNLRASYKSITWEFTLLCEFYWMIMQMSAQFMQPETALVLLGDDMRNFDPDGDYVFKPVSSAIEAEYSKMNKVKNYDQMLGRLAGLAKVTPAVIPILAIIVAKQFELMGAEFQDIRDAVMKLAVTPPTPEKGAETPADANGMPMSNQAGVPMGLLEQDTREMANA